MKVLILGASGMIGHAIFQTLSKSTNLDVWGTVRSKKLIELFPKQEQNNLLILTDFNDQDNIVQTLAKVNPDIVINCIGLTKHHKEAGDPLLAIPINALLPHRLSELCKLAKARFIHVSTDCVFDGTQGNYVESDLPNATDIYGKSKHLGEELQGAHAITLRTSTIGHELQSQYGLLEWFLAQNNTCRGFNKAIFSGLPSVVFAEIIQNHVFPNPKLCGLYHVGSEPIRKYDLLQLIAKQYQKQIQIIKDDEFIIDRSLNSKRFMLATGYKPIFWPELVQKMHIQSEGYDV